MKKSILVAAMCISAVSGYAKESKPNVLMIFVDDLHYGALGFTGSVMTKAKTPRIDRLFNEGVFFPNAYATHATCAPSRGGLLTGRYQARFNHETLPGKSKDREETNYGIKTSEIMMPVFMKQGGYATAAFGKWHVGYNTEFQPNARGFDYFFGYRGQCSYYQFGSQNKSANKREELKPVSDREEPILDIVRNGKSLRVPGYLTDHFTNDAADWMKKQAAADQPFFVYFAPFNVHGPNTVPAKYIPKGGTPHDGVIAAMDASVGTLLDAIDEAGVTDHTLVVFANDNGGKKDYTRTFRGNKATFYQGGIRVPFAMRWPGRIKAGTTFDGMVSTLDMLPTFAALAGAELPTDRVYDGKDLMPFIDGDKPAEELRQTHFWRNGGCRAAINGDWKMLWFADKRKHKALLEKLGIVNKKGRKVIYAERADSLYTVVELYNLADDPMESKDLSKSHPEKVQEMIKTYRDWEETIPKWNE